MERLNIAAEIKARLTMAEVLERYGLHPNAKGFVCCPFHNEKTPSFKAYDGDRGYHCFGCGATGDIIDFTRKYLDTDFTGALRRLNSDFGLGLGLGGRPPSLREYRAAQRRERAREAERLEREQLDRELTFWRDEWARLDIAKRQYRPKSMGDTPDSRFIEAITGLGWAAYNIDILEARQYELAKQS